jgi:hypothetical protein
MDDPRIQKLLDSRRAGEHDRPRQMEIEAAEAWWETLTEEQRQVYITLGYDARFFLMEKASKLQRKEPEGR